MRIGVISDLHLGDRRCRLLRDGTVTETYRQFKDAVLEFTEGDPLDYLVLNGDILDFSINSFEDSCNTARPFFQALQADHLCREIIYIPGNHDKHIWDAVEWETCIIRRLRAHRRPRPFKRTQPGVIDLTSETPVLELTGVSRAPARNTYGTLFLEGLFKKGKVIPISIVYPNLYIGTTSGVVLITHGHMLELAWVLLSELLSGLPEFSMIGIRELEEYNIPITAVICTGVGQAGKVSRLFYTIQQEAKLGRTDTLRRVLDRVNPTAEKMIELSGLYEVLDNILLYALKRAIISIAERVTDARYDRDFFNRDSVRKRFFRFYAASCSQAEELGLPPPERIIFGHTHEPIPADAPMIVEEVSEPSVRRLYLYNTGGWLEAEGKSAAVFFMDREGRLTTKEIT